VAAVLVKQKITRNWLISALIVVALVIVAGGMGVYGFLTTSPATRTIALYELNRHPLGHKGDWKGVELEPINISDTKQLESDLSPGYYNGGSYSLRPCIRHMSRGIKLTEVFLTLRIASQLGIEVRNQRPEWQHVTKDGYEEYTTVIPEVAYRTIQPTPGWFEFNRSGHESFEIAYRVEGKDELGRTVATKDEVITLVGLKSK
jgi:hypothetical protein